MKGDGWGEIELMELEHAETNFDSQRPVRTQLMHYPVLRYQNSGTQVLELSKSEAKHIDLFFL